MSSELVPPTVHTTLPVALVGNNSRSSNCLHVSGKSSKETDVRGIDGVRRGPHSCTLHDVRFMPHSARIGVVLASIELHVIFIVNKLPKIQNAPQGAGRLIAVSVERQVPLEVGTTRFFNVNLWSAPPSVYTTLSWHYNR